MTLGDLDAGLRLCRASRWNQVAEDWRCFLDSPAGSGWAAEIDGVVVGTSAAIRYRPGFAWLSMMLVDPAHRRRGIGARLLAAALEALADEACVRLDATPAGEPLYRRCGFVAEYPLTRATAVSAAQPAPQGVRPIAPADLDGVLARDREVFGSDRGAILRSFYERAPELAAIAADGSYCFGRPGHLYSQIGPVVAESAAAAQRLVAHCLPRHSGAVAIDVPQHSPEWIAWLERAGFVMERPFLRMRRGGNATPGEPARQFAIAGPEFG